ncbi:hypothetical protein [uncultured Aquimarina sp.]|uniref:hypothetical protein n=1 Tax=uncultured Aquimarina sp. TaxID=575652 RepID=UPI002627CD92|nr:hypothetical protein [uncultured Aquimarina sp.]
MLFKIKSYLFFLWRSTNQHGVHSPFVYNLVTKCFYDRDKKASYVSITSIYKNNASEISLKNLKLLNRLIGYLKYKKILVTKKSSSFIDKVLSVDNFTTIYYSPEDLDQFDFIYLDIDQFKKHPGLLDILLSKTHNDSLLLLNSINKSKENQNIWQQLHNHPKTKVTIDTYNLGFVFFRKEQEKEHFVIRV